MRDTKIPGQPLGFPDGAGHCSGAILFFILTMALAGAPDVFGAARNSTAAPNLKSSTIEAFDRYIRLTEERNEAELQKGANLLWVDALDEAHRTKAYAELKGGEVKMQRLETRSSDGAIRCPDGMIHHWVGAIFVPGAKLRDVLGVLEDYDRQAAYYAPDVERSKIESREGDHFRVYLRFRRHKVLTVVLDTEHDVRYFHDSDTRAHSRSSAVRIAEIENADNKGEREKAPGEDHGFLWRMETWWRMDEDDSGVYVQSEVASLTRDIPTGLAWLIGPFVTSIPKETLTFTLQATRKAVEARRHAATK